MISDRMFPARQGCGGDAADRKNEGNAGRHNASRNVLATAEFQQRFPGELSAVSPAGRENCKRFRTKIQTRSAGSESRETSARISSSAFTQSYGRELISVKPFPALSSTYSRLMAECWDSAALDWARLADELGYSPVLLSGRMAPQLTRRMVHRFFVSQLQYWRYLLLCRKPGK